MWADGNDAVAMLIYLALLCEMMVYVCEPVRYHLMNESLYETATWHLSVMGCHRACTYLSLCQVPAWNTTIVSKQELPVFSNTSLSFSHCKGSTITMSGESWQAVEKLSAPKVGLQELIEIFLPVKINILTGKMNVSWS